MKLMVIGHGRHGKDTVCELLDQHLGLTWQSSSWAVADTIIFPVLGPKYGYQTVDECYADRSNHRSEWFDLIAAYNEGDPARFSRELLSRFDIYCGLRNRTELLAAKQEELYDLCIWVDASKRLPPESDASCTVTSDDADIIIPNNQNLAALRDRVERFAELCWPAV